MTPQRSIRQNTKQIPLTAVKSGRVSKNTKGVKDESGRSISVESSLTCCSQQPVVENTPVSKPSKRNTKLPTASKKKKPTKTPAKNKKSKVVDDEAKLKGIQELRYKYRQCQTCFKLYESYFRAECCFRSHGDTSLRCFFCVTPFPDTVSLYEHYSNGQHERGPKEDTIICNLCNKTLKFSSASTHVISMHLTENEFEAQ